MSNELKKLLQSLPYEEVTKEGISIKGLLMHLSEEIVRFVIFPVVLEVQRSDIIRIEEEELPTDHTRYSFPTVNLVVKRGASLQDMYVCPLPELIGDITAIFALHARSEFKNFVPLYKDYLQLEDEYRIKFGL